MNVKSMGRKFLSALLVVLMLTAMLPTALAAEDSLVPAVSLNLPTPVAGAQPLAYVQEGEHYRAEGLWQNGPETFTAGETYTLSITVTAAEGFTFAEGVTVVDGEKHDIPHVCTEDHRTLTLTVTRTAAEAPKAQQTDAAPGLITQVDLPTPEKPAAGAHPENFVLNDAGTHYTVTGTWKLKGEAMAPESVFEIGSTYELVMEVLPDEGYAFADELTVNGQKTASPGAVLTGTRTYLLEEPVNVAAIRRDGKDLLYTTLDAAIEDAVSGETIRLLASTSTAWTQGYYMGKSLTFDLGGFQVTFPAGFCISGGSTVKFQNGRVTMNGITKGCNDSGSYSFPAAIVINGSASLALENAVMDITGTQGDGIYGHPDCKILLNSATLNITGSSLNGITKDDPLAEIRLTGRSRLNITGNKAGITNTWNVYVTDSELNVSSNRGNGSNGSNYTMTKAVVSFNGNGSHGMSAGTVTGTDSVLTANDNGCNGIHAAGPLTLTNCTTTVNGNKCSSKWSKPGAMLLNAESAITGGKLTVSGNSGSGIHVVSGGLTVDGTAATVVGNTAQLEGLGGGLRAEAPVVLKGSVAIANNHAAQAGDDIYSTAALTLVKAPSLALDGLEGNCTRMIDGWYQDGAGARWNAHDLQKLHVEPVPVGTLEGTAALKAAHNTVSVETHNPAALTFRKVEATTGEPIDQVTFTLYTDAACTEKVESCTTDKNGSFTVELAAGTYYLKETGTPAGYRPDSAVLEIRVTDGEADVEQTLENGEVTVKTTTDAAAQVVNRTPDKDGVYVVKNQAVRNVTIRKVWKDNDNKNKTRAEKVELSFLANGREIERYTLTAKDQWQLTIEDLPVYDENGKAIEYTVKELTKVKDYNVSYQDKGLTAVNTLKGVTPQTGDESNIFLWVGVMAVSAVCVVGLLFAMKKKSGKD